MLRGLGYGVMLRLSRVRVSLREPCDSRTACILRLAPLSPPLEEKGS